MIREDVFKEKDKAEIAGRGGAETGRFEVRKAEDQLGVERCQKQRFLRPRPEHQFNKFVITRHQNHGGRGVRDREDQLLQDAAFEKEKHAAKRKDSDRPLQQTLQSYRRNAQTSALPAARKR